MCPYALIAIDILILAGICYILDSLCMCVCTQQ